MSTVIITPQNSSEGTPYLIPTGWHHRAVVTDRGHAHVTEGGIVDVESGGVANVWFGGFAKVQPGGRAYLREPGAKRQVMTPEGPVIELAVDDSVVAVEVEPWEGEL